MPPVGLPAEWVIVVLFLMFIGVILATIGNLIMDLWDYLKTKNDRDKN